GDSPPPGFQGRFTLTLGPDGVARLEHEAGGILRRWSARVDAVVWPRLLAALRRTDFPHLPGYRGGSDGVRELRVTGVEPAGARWLGWGRGTEAGMAGPLTILDALVHQVGNGTVPGVPDQLPWLTYEVSEEDAADGGPVPMPLAAFGTLGGRPVSGIVRVDGGVTVLGLPDGAVLAELKPTGVPPRAVAFTEVDGTDLIVTGGDDGLLRIWAADGTPMTAQIRHTAPVSAIACSVDDATLVIWSADRAGGLLQRGLWPDGPVRAWPDHPAGIPALCWAGSGTDRVLVSGAEGGCVRLLREGRPDEVWPAHAGRVNAVAAIRATGDFLVA